MEPQTDRTSLFFGLGVALVVLPFLAGLLPALQTTPPHIETAEEVEAAARVVPEYLGMPIPVIQTFPKFGQSLSVKLTLVLPTGNPAIASLRSQIESYDPRYNTLIANAILAAGDTASKATDLVELVPVKVREALNQTFGTEDNPEPVTEVLLTTFTLR